MLLALKSRAMNAPKISGQRFWTIEYAGVPALALIMKPSAHGARGAVPWNLTGFVAIRCSNNLAQSK
jgi:hypothetical protein